VHLVGFIIRTFSYFLCFICRYYLRTLAAIIIGTRKKVINAGKEKEIQTERRVIYIVFLSTAVVPSTPLLITKTCLGSSQLYRSCVKCFACQCQTCNVKWCLLKCERVKVFQIQLHHEWVRVTEIRWLEKEQDMKCTFNIPLRRVRVTRVTVEKQ
jgi:hypothetical protein